VALLLSDHIWLWSRGHDGGGPQGELLRRIAHWTMKEPELEEEDLTARIDHGRLSVVRRSLEAGPPPEIAVTAPDGGVTRHRPEPRGGRAVLELPATQPGVWQASDGRRTAFAAAEAGNPLELAARCAGWVRRPLRRCRSCAASRRGGTWRGRAGSGCAATPTIP
jgi:hypothetical protein